jgi:hypothetical protein
MKKGCAWLAALMLLAILPATALAEGEASPDASAGTEQPAAVTLSIDNANVYSGMDKAYKDGYTPAVSGGVATIVLPLVASGAVKGDSVTATPGLGDTSSSPFIYKNYQKNVSLQDNPVNGSSTTVPSYLVVFELALASGRINGVYPVAIDVAGQDTNGNAVTFSVTCYVTITDGRNPDTATAEAPQSQPKLIVGSYAVNPSPVEAGGEFTATVTLRNTSETRAVKNIAVTISCDSMNFLLLNDSNVVYIDKIAKGGTRDIEIRYKTDLGTAPQRYTLSLAMEYDCSEATSLASSGLVTVEVAQPLRVELKAPAVEPDVNAGDTMPLSFQVMNLGRGPVYNVRIELSAPGLIPTGTAFIGNMEPGTSANAEMDVFVGTKNMSEGYDGGEKYGYTSGKLTLIYEDTEGTEYTQETEIATTIHEPVIAASADSTEEETKTAGQWWLSIAIGVAAIAGLTAFLAIRKKREGKMHEDT